MTAEAKGKLTLETSYNPSGLDQAAGAIKAFESTLSSMSGKLSTVTLGLTGLFAKTVLSGIEEAAGNFEKLHKGMAISSGDLDALKKATGGTIDSLTLVTAHNRMMLEGVKLSKEEMAGLFGEVKRVSIAMGADCSEGIAL